MKKTLRFLAVVLVLSLFAAMAMGSGSKEPGELKDPASVSTNGKDPTADSAGGNAEGGNETAAPVQKDETIEETVLYDEANVKITAKSLDVNGIFGPALKLLIENNSDKTLTVQARQTSVNGYMVQSMLSPEVAPGKKANDELIFQRSDLDAAGITTIADMEFSFHIFNSDDWSDALDTERYSIKTSAAEGFAYTYDNSGHGVYNANGVEIVVKGLSDESLFGPGIVVYISNTSNQDVGVQVREVSVNGFMIDPIFSSEVVAGKHAISAITFLSNVLEENNITTIENVELSFHIFDAKTWATIEDTTPVTITFEN